MKLRHKTNGDLCESHAFNVHALSEILVTFPDGSRDSDYISNYEVFLPDGTCKELAQAFRDRDVVPNNYNSVFGLPIDDAARQRGYNL